MDWFSLLGGAYYSKGKVPTPGRQAPVKAKDAPPPKAQGPVRRSAAAVPGGVNRVTTVPAAAARRERIIAADRIFRA